LKPAGGRLRFAYSCKEAGREQADREREAAEQGAGKLIEAERKDTRPDRRAEKKKDGRAPCDIVVLLSIVLYGAMEHIYSSRAMIPKARRKSCFSIAPSFPAYAGSGL
jgi:hypothetical protein